QRGRRQLADDLFPEEGPERPGRLLPALDGRGVGLGPERLFATVARLAEQPLREGDELVELPVQPGRRVKTVAPVRRRLPAGPWCRRLAAQALQEGLQRRVAARQIAVAQQWP